MLKETKKEAISRQDTPQVGFGPKWGLLDFPERRDPGYKVKKKQKTPFELNAHGSLNLHLVFSSRTRDKITSF